MSDTTWAVTRLRMPSAGSPTGMFAGGVVSCATTALAAAVSAYKPSIADTRNDAQGGADAWSPPV